MLLKNATVYGEDFEPKKADVLIHGEKIVKVGKIAEDEAIFLTGLTLIPGLIDIHLHGCAGEDFLQFSENSLSVASNWLAEHGITSFCPTYSTRPIEQLEAAIDNTKEKKDKLEGAYVLGLHLEGRYISAKKRGAQLSHYISPANSEEFLALQEKSGGLFCLVVVAPEVSRAMDFIREVSKVCTVSVAHSDADYDTTVSAFRAGASHVTHLYNGMTELHHRNPGVVGATLDRAKEMGVFAELICDGFHIHPAALRIAFKALGEDNSVIVSDSMSAAGCADGEYTAGGGDIVKVVDGKSVLPDGTISASTTNVYDQLKNVIRYGVPLKQAIKSATINAAKSIGMDSITGSISVGKNADLVAVDDNFNIRMVIIKGKIVVNNL